MSEMNTNDKEEDVNCEAKTSQPNDHKSDTKHKPTEDQDIDLSVEALNHLNQGKRHLLVEDYSSAVISLQESCQLFDQVFGIGREECGEAYLYYGTALLELARQEDGVFDGVVHTKLAEISGSEDEEEEEDEDSQDSQDDIQTKDTKPEEKKTDIEEDIEDSDGEKRKKETEIESESKNSVVAEMSTSASNADNNVECLPSTSKTEPNTEEDNTDDEASNIEVSWEVLSLAKEVFLRHLDKNDNRLKLSETLQKLGEISIEWENNKNAIEILTECLTLRKEALPEDDRLIAEAYYHLGIAFSFNSHIENANNCFHSAIQVFETRISNQKKKLLTINAEDFEAIATIKREINQLENILPDLRAKIEDSKDQMFNVKEALEREENERIKEDAIASKNKELKEMPVKDISHLIKRKRQNSGPETTPKKLCSNGHNADNEKTSEDTSTTT